MRSAFHYPLRIVLCLAATLFVATRCPAGLGTTTGKEWHRWTGDKYSVILARVLEIKDLTPRVEPTHSAVLAPIATLAGQLDPSEHPILNVTFYVGRLETGTSIKEAPPKDALVLVVLQEDSFIVSDICRFMPNESAIAVVTGLGDPKVEETLKKLQEARAHPDPDPYSHGPASRPSTQPTTKPKA